MLRKKVYSDAPPHFEVTSFPAHWDILPWRGRNILPHPLSPSACLLAHQKPQRRHNTMYSKVPTSGMPTTMRLVYSTPIKIGPP